MPIPAASTVGTIQAYASESWNQGAKQEPILQQLLAVNRGDGPPVLPLRIGTTRGEWHAAPGVEFYVDFEYCSDLNDDFSKLPEKGGQPLIFMVGCGHVEKGEWRFKSLVANDLSETEEIRIIQDWVDHMSAVRDRTRPCQRQASHFPLGARRTNYAAKRSQFGMEQAQSARRLARFRLVRFPPEGDAAGARGGERRAGFRPESGGQRHALSRASSKPTGPAARSTAWGQWWALGAAMRRPGGEVCR